MYSYLNQFSFKQQFQNKESLEQSRPQNEQIKNKKEAME